MGGIFFNLAPENAIATKIQGLAVELYLDTILFVDQRNHFGPGSVVSFLGADYLRCKKSSWGLGLLNTNTAD